MMGWLAAWALAGLSIVGGAADPSRGICPQDLARAYRNVLYLQAAGQHREAAMGLAGLYSDCKVAEELDEVVGRCVSLLSTRGEQGALLPVLVLHRDASRILAHAGNQALAARGRRHFDKILDLLLRTTAREQGDGAAVALAHAGIERRDHGYLESARELFAQALEHSPERPELFHLLGTLDEKRGDYDLAARSFKRLLEVEPEDEVGRLRLALVEVRRRKDKSASEHFRRLMERCGVPWACTLAFEESARLEIEVGQIDRGLEILREGRRRFPEDQALLIASSRWENASRTATRLPLETLAGDVEAGDVPATSPRGTYNDWPAVAAASVVEALEHAVADHLPVLERSLRIVELSLR
ncbi:MAG: hypothetical protein KDD47_08885 [Acidobacteria bacterium]|nr:hypothetical protein [Acidobacteriota bacterium]